MSEPLCPHCLQPLRGRYEGNCPHCGRSLENRNPEGALPLGTQLAGRYTIGTYLSADGDGLAYRGILNEEKKFVLIKEYFPVTLCNGRSPEGALMPKEGKEVLFKTSRMDFKDLYDDLHNLTPATGLNTILDVWFVVSFGWGVVGVAVATVIAQAASAAVSVAYMFIKYPIFRFKKGEFVFDREKFGISLRLGVPAIIQQAVISLGNVFIQRLVNSFDQTTMSAFTVGNRMEAYALVPIFGLNSGVATFTGQNVGAQKYDRVHRGWRVSTIMSCVSSVAIALTINLLAGDFARLFNLGGVSMAKAVEYQRYMSYCVVLFAAYMPTSGLLQGAGDAIWASVTSLATLSARVAVSYLLAYAFNVGYASCWLSLPVGWALGIAITYPRYFSKKWMTKRVVRDPLPVSAEEGEEALGLE